MEMMEGSNHEPAAPALAARMSAPHTSVVPQHGGGSKRRARRLAPKVSRRKLSDTSDDGTLQYVEFLQFVRSPPGTTLSDIETRGEAARLAAIAAGCRSNHGTSEQREAVGRGGSTTMPAVVDDEHGPPPLGSPSGSERQRSEKAGDGLSSLLASLAISGRRNDGSRDENYSAYTSMFDTTADLADADDDDYGMPDLDDASYCAGPASEGTSGMSAMPPAPPRETSADEVLAWTALGMLLGNDNHIIMDGTTAKKNRRGRRRGKGSRAGGVVAFESGVDGGEDMPTVVPSPIATPDRTASGYGRAEDGGPRYDSVDATNSHNTRMDDLLMSAMRDSGDGRDEGGVDDDGSEADEIGDAVPPEQAMADRPAAERGVPPALPLGEHDDIVGTPVIDDARAMRGDGDDDDDDNESLGNEGGKTCEVLPETAADKPAEPVDIPPADNGVDPPLIEGAARPVFRVALVQQTRKKSRGFFGSVREGTKKMTPKAIRKGLRRKGRMA